MTSRHSYRYSVIPGDSVTDARLEGRDLQVVALLGRHTRNGGWCWRSQVKMAAEIRCGRGTIQRSLDRLVLYGWVEKRPMGRKGVAPNPDKQPFSPYWYRVIMDNVVPEEFLLQDDEEEFDPSVPDIDTCPPVGTLDSGHGGAHVDEHGGAQVARAPIEGPPLEATPLETGERENARARELKKFKKKYPSAAYEDQTKIDNEWNALTDDDWPNAIKFIEPFLAGRKRLGRTHVPAAWTYLHDRPWVHMSTETVQPTSIFFDAWSKDWWAALFAKADRGERLSFHVDWAIQGKKFAVKYDTMPSPETIAVLKPFRANGPEAAAWHPWVRERGGKLPEWTQDFWVFLPSPEPPVAGTPALRITGPPVAV